MRVIIIICHWFQPLEDYQPGLERGRWAEPAVQKWVSCFHNSRPFPTTSSTSTTACWHGELHLTRRAPSHHDGLLTRRAPSHHEGLLTPHCITASPLPPLATATGYRHWPVLCVELPAARYAQKTHAHFAHYGLFAHVQCAFGMADWLNRLRAFIIYTVFLIKKKKCKKSTVSSAASSVALHGLPKADHCGQRIEYRTRNSEDSCSIPSLASVCG